MSELKVNKVTPRSGTTVTIGDSGEHLALAGNIGLGGATPTTSGTGITFPATQSASTNANTLDDYEEGTWTPTLAGGFSTAPTSYTSQGGSYVKIGRFVYFQFDLNANGVIADGSRIEFSGLPFTTGSDSVFYGGAQVSYQISFNTNNGDVYHIPPNNTLIRVYNNAGSDRAGNSANVNLNNQLLMYGFYQV